MDDQFGTHTVAEMIVAQERADGGMGQREAVTKRLTDAETRLRCHQAEIYAMIDSLGDVGAALNDNLPDSSTRSRPVRSG